LDCIEDWAGENSALCPIDKSKIVLDQMTKNFTLGKFTDKLKVKCSLSVNGCEWTGERSNLREHLSCCEFEIIFCPFDCGIKDLKIKDLKAHKEICDYRKILCECQEIILALHFEDHKTFKCVKTEVECPKCQIKLVRGIVENHLQVDCPNQEVSCPHSTYGCNQKCNRKSLQEHLRNCSFEELKYFISGIWKKCQDLTEIVAKQQKNH